MNEYNINYFDKNLCNLVRFIRGTNNPPKILLKRSQKKYGWRNDLVRYWWKQFYNIYIGRFTYGFNKLSPDLLKSIGSYTSIAEGVTLVPNTHNMNYCTTSPILSHKMFGFIDKDVVYDYCPNFEKSIVIGNDVWIGVNCIIFNNVTIGDGAVIAAGSIIRKDVPPYAVVGGVDRIIKYRFSQDIIEKLLKIKWWDWSDEKIKENINLLYDPQKFVDQFYK